MPEGSNRRDWSRSPRQSPIAPETSPLTNLSSSILAPPSIITAAASWRERSLQRLPRCACRGCDVCAPPDRHRRRRVISRINRRSTASRRARASTSATKRASLPLVFIVANTATVGLDELKKASRDVCLALDQCS